MGALDQIDTWPAPTAAGAVTVRRTPDAPIVTVTHGDIEHRFRIASISKTISALAMMIAVEEGSIDLDQPVSVPAPTGTTMRHLLAHASGLPFDGREPIAAVGERRIYSNTGIELAAEEVASRTGIDFGAYLDEAVLDPLGMSSTELKGSPAHGLWSTVADLTRFVSELLEPRLIAATTWSEMTRIQYPDLGGIVPGVGGFQPCPWGLGFEIHGEKYPHWMGRENSAQTFGHFGGAGTMMWVDPVANVGLVALTDLAFDRWSDTVVRSWRELSDAVLAEATP